MRGEEHEPGDDQLISAPTEIQVARWMIVLGAAVTLLALVQLFALVTYEDAGQLRPTARTVSATRATTSAESSASSARAA